jgi:hypothetical protein
MLVPFCRKIFVGGVAWETTEGEFLCYLLLIGRASESDLSNSDAIIKTMYRHEVGNSCRSPIKGEEGVISLCGK